MCVPAVMNGLLFGVAGVTVRRGGQVSVVCNAGFPRRTLSARYVFGRCVIVTVLCCARRADASVGFTSVLPAFRWMSILIDILAFNAGKVRLLHARPVASIVVFGNPGGDACV